VITLVAVVVVAGLAAGLVVWAPWTPPPVLRPAGLTAGPATANSVSLRWSPPATGPLPEKYLILSNGTAAATVAGTITSYRQAALTPASTYQYHLVAVRGGKRSPPSAPLAVRTLTPPVSQARLRGPWDIRGKFIHTGGQAPVLRADPVGLVGLEGVAAGGRVAQLRVAVVHRRWPGGLHRRADQLPVPQPG
jgi:hypothetical protein